MTQPLLVVRSRPVVTEAVGPGAIPVRGGRIERVAAWDDVPAGAALDDVGELAVLPGIVDTHVYLNEPGRTEWEGFATATRAAAVPAAAEDANPAAARAELVRSAGPACREPGRAGDASAAVAAIRRVVHARV